MMRRTDTADVEAAHGGTEEAVSQANAVLVRVVGIFQRVDVTALPVHGENEAGRQPPILGRVEAGAQIFHVAAKPGEILTEDDPVTASRANSVRIVVSHRCADGRGQVLAQFVAKIRPAFNGSQIRADRAAARYHPDPRGR